MADKTTKILEVTVDNNKAIAAISEYNRLIDEQKAKQAALSQQFKDGAITEAEYYKGMANSKEVVKTYSREVQELSKEMQNNIKVGREKQGSLRALRAELSNITKAYDSLSKEERESASGQEMKEKVRELTQSLRDMEHETGRDFRNVGNYLSAMGGKIREVAINASGTKGPINNMGFALQGISKIGIVRVLEAIVAVLGFVIKNLKSSEENANRMAIALAPLKAGGTALTKIFQWLGGALASAAEWLGKMADRLGIVNEKMKNEQQIVKDEIELQKERRRVNEENADLELEIAQLKAKASEKDKYTAKERKAFIEESIALERKLADNNIRLAREEFRIADERSQLAGNSKEENDALSEAKVNLTKAETDYFNKVKELNAQRVEAINAIKSETKANEDLKVSKSELTDIIEREIELMIKSYSEESDIDVKELERKKQVIDERLKLVEEGSLAEYEYKKEQLGRQLELDVIRLQAEAGNEELIKEKRYQYYKELRELEEAYKWDVQTMLDDLLNESIKSQMSEWANEKTILEEKKKMYQETYSAIGGAVSSLSQLLAQAGEDNKTLTQMSKMLALAQIAIETGVATAKGISAAQSVPYPGNLAAIATTIATILSGITSAVSTVRSAKFATGGYVSGPGTGTSDSINARLSNGESVINARSTAMFGPLLSTLNQAGGGIAFNPAKGASKDGYAFLASAVASGMQAAKLEVAVSEIQRVESQVAHIKERSVIG